MICPSSASFRILAALVILFKLNGNQIQLRAYIHILKRNEGWYDGSDAELHYMYFSFELWVYGPPAQLYPSTDTMQAKRNQWGYIDKSRYPLLYSSVPSPPTNTDADSRRRTPRSRNRKTHAQQRYATNPQSQNFNPSKAKLH